MRVPHLLFLLRVRQASEEEDEVSLLDGFDSKAKALDPRCQCGEYEPARTAHESFFLMMYYGPPGSRPIIPERKWCRHRSIKLALIRAYRAGRAEAKERGIE